MKIRVIALFLAAVGMSMAANVQREEKKPELPRLTDVAAFPQKDRDAVRTIIAAVSASGGKPQEYFAELSLGKDGQIDVYLRHESHPTDDSKWLGDPCGHCRITRYDPKSGKIAPFRGIR